jgi:preprotein translocase SecE subunit
LVKSLIGESIMTVAVKNSSEVKARAVLGGLAVESFIGTIGLLVATTLIFWAVPALWSAGAARVFGSLTYVSGTIEIIVMLALAGVLARLGFRWLSSHSIPGLRAAIVINCLCLVVFLLFISAIGMRLEAIWGASDPTLGALACIILALALLALLIYAYLRPGTDRLVVRLEEQGWFEAKAYKRSQGQMVRRGTIVGILTLAGCGIFTMLRHNTLAAASRDWRVPLPFTGGRSLTLLPALPLTLPLLLAALSLWLAYRIVNLPVFADFLIATEAEVNKVSWTTRKRLVQDTIVVLVTVILLTLFLFVVDQAWAFVLTRIGVVQITTAAAQQQRPGQLSW